MTIAEIHGKLRHFESMEDLLTSDVFGTFKYCNPHEGLIPFLKQAVTFDGSTAGLAFLNDVKSAEYFFWPRSKSRREPDVIIILKLQNGEDVAINIEAKYFSGKHNIGVDDIDELDDKSVYESEEMKYHAGDQLVDQFWALKENLYMQKDICEALKKCKIFYLFYITAHYVLPVQDVWETQDAIKDKLKHNEIDIVCFYWLNWRQAWNVCCPSKHDNGETKLMLDDLCRLLERKGLKELSLWKDKYYSIGSDPHFWMEEKRFWQIEFQFEQNHNGWFFWNTGT